MNKKSLLPVEVRDFFSHAPCVIFSVEGGEFVRDIAFRKSLRYLEFRGWKIIKKPCGNWVLAGFRGENSFRIMIREEFDDFGGYVQVEADLPDGSTFTSTQLQPEDGMTFLVNLEDGSVTELYCEVVKPASEK